MAGFTIKETIKRSQEQVFHVLANPGSVTFIENIRNTEKITDGPVGVGTRFRETRLINGKEEYGEMEIVQFEPNKVVSYASDTQGIRVLYDYVLDEVEGGTRIEWTCTVTAQGLKKAMVPVVVGIMKKEDGDHLQQLKAALENEPA